MLSIVAAELAMGSVTRGNREVESSEDLDRAGGARRERCMERELPLSIAKVETLADIIPNESLDRVARGIRRRLPRRDAASSVDAIVVVVAFSNGAVVVGVVSSLECRFDLDKDEEDDDAAGADRRIRSRARARLGSSNSLISSRDPMEERE